MKQIILICLVFMLIALSQLAFSQTLEYIDSFASDDLRDVIVDGDYAYCSNYNTIKSFDVSDPMNIQEIGSYTDYQLFIYDYTIAGNYIFVATGQPGLWILDISDPANIIKVGQYSLNFSEYSFNNIRISGNYAYLAYHRFYGYNRCGLKILDISDIENIIEVGDCGFPHDFYGADIVTEEHYAYLIFIDSHWGSSYLKVVDISNKSNPFETGSLYLTGSYNIDVSLIGDLLYYTATYYSYAIDISDPYDPNIQFDTYSWYALGHFIFGDYMIMATENLVLYDIENPLAPLYLIEHDSPGTAKEVYKASQYVYVADDSLLSVYRWNGNCNIVLGDANGSGVFNGLDVIYSVNYLKGTGPSPPVICDCSPNHQFQAAADANGDCLFNGLDIIFMLRYFKGEISRPQLCVHCD